MRSIVTQQSSYTNMHPDSEGGFTILELLIVIGVLAAVVCVTAPAMTQNAERARRIVCLNNLRQMGRGSQMYSEDDSQGRLTGTLATDPVQQQGDADVNWLHGFGPSFCPGYIQDLNTFICPSTRNSINPNKITTVNPQGTTFIIKELTDLLTKAPDNLHTNGHSYEVFGCWIGLFHSYPRKTAHAVLTYAHQNGPLQGVVAGPSQTLVLVDRMEQHLGLNHENYPNLLDGHGQDGANAVFADSHAEWIGTTDWNYRYELSQDEGRQLTPYNPTW